jgi:hypothetical protein
VRILISSSIRGEAHLNLLPFSPTFADALSTPYPASVKFVWTITRPIHKILQRCNLYCHLCTYTQSMGTNLEPQVNLSSWPKYLTLCEGLPYEFFLGWGLLAAMHIYASNAEHSAWSDMVSGVGWVVHLVVRGKPHLTAVKRMVINILQYLSVTCTCGVTGLKESTVRVAERVWARNVVLWGKSPCWVVLTCHRPLWGSFLPFLLVSHQVAAKGSNNRSDILVKMKG